MTQVAPQPAALPAGQTAAESIGAAELARLAKKSIKTDLQVVLDKADEHIRNAQPNVLRELKVLEAAVIRAQAMDALRDALDNNVMRTFFPLMNSALGFRTDKAKPDGDRYSVDEVREFLIECLLMGVHPVGNEANIIGGRMYVTKEGLARLVREYPGLTDLKLTPGVPKLARDNKGEVSGAIVPYKATFRINGHAREIEREIPVKVNAYMGIDAIVGKATRKILAAVYGLLTGSEHAFPEGEIDDAPSRPAAEPAGPSAAERLEQLKAKQAAEREAEQKAQQEIRQTTTRVSANPNDEPPADFKEGQPLDLG